MSEEEIEDFDEEEEDEDYEDDEEDMETEEGLDYKIENVVATVVVEITEKIDLNQIARKHADVEYNPERFPGLVMRIEKPRATILIFSTGKKSGSPLFTEKWWSRDLEKRVKHPA